MKSVHFSFIGRLGNVMFQYANARSFAEKNGLELKTSRWIGEHIFDLPDHTGEADMTSDHGYAQSQSDLTYTRKQAREWFRFKPEIAAKLSILKPLDVVIHKRRGDYAGCGYPLVSMRSYVNAITQYGMDGDNATILAEEHPTQHSAFTGELSFLPDFWHMMYCKTLLRANSSFSWWAATLGMCDVYSPVINDAKGGVENDVPFLKGNFPRLACFPFTTDLHLAED